MSIDHLIQKIYLDLFQDDATKTILGITFLELDLNKLKDQSAILEFSDWANLSEIRKYDKDWISEFTLDLLKRSIQFDLSNCFKALCEYCGYGKEDDSFYYLIEQAIHNSSIKCIDYLVSKLPHPDYEIFPGSGTLYTRSLMMGNLKVASHMLSTYKCHPDGLKVIDESGTREDYRDVIDTVDSGSILTSIMISPYINDIDKLHMMDYALSNEANIQGHSPSPLTECFDSPIEVACSIKKIFLDYFLSLGISKSYTGIELMYPTVCSKAPFEDKVKVIDRLFEVYDIDVNLIPKKRQVPLVQYAIIKNRKDSLETVLYLILKGAYYDADNLIQLAHDNRHYELRDALFSSLEGSVSLYNTMQEEERILKQKESQYLNSNEPKVWVIFPEKDY
jgi:hypothetical protein